MGFCCWFEWFISLWRVWLTIFIMQGFLGIAMFEWGWKRVERLRLGEKECWDEFPSFKNLDAHKWTRLQFYPGAFCMLLPRTIWIFSWLFGIGIWQVLLFIGHPNRDVPLNGWRRTIHKWVLWTYVPMIILGFGYVINHTKHDESDTDYSKYLGPEWKKNKFKGKRISTIVSNHIGFIEVMLYISIMTPPAFTPAHFVKKFPIGHHYVSALQSLYVDRT